MGLFDRIKKAFTGKDNSESKKDEELEKKSQETDQSTETDKTSTDSDKGEEVTEPKPTTEDTEEKVKEATPETKESAESASSDDQKVESTVEKEVTSTEKVDLNSTESDKKIVSETKPDEIESTKESVKTNEAENTSEETVTETSESTNDKLQEETPEKAPTTPKETSKEESKNDVEEYDEGLKKSRNSFSARFNRFLANFRSVDEDFFDDLEELLIESDVGYETAVRISDELREEVKLENAKKRSDVSNVIVKKLVDMYGEEGKDEDNSLKFSTDKTPTIFLFVGVNGVGKTTTIGKLAHRYQQEGKKVLLAAGDTFRAGAIEQLQEWGKRVNVPVQASKAHTDPASVVYDAVQRAINEDFDILLVDTAGRLQNKEGLMRELEKIKRVITRELPEAPQEVLLVLDGSTGQNALSQAKQFNETTAVSGIVLTKLDGSSQGGIVLAIRNELHIPVKLVGLGEQMDDLRDFDPEKFIYGLFKELIVGASDK